MDMKMDLIERTKDNSLELSSFHMNKEDALTVGIYKTIDKAAEYVIKALPVPDSIKDILQDIRESIKTKDIKNVLSTAVKSTIREGLEILGITNGDVKSLMELKNVASKGRTCFDCKKCN